MTYDATGHLRAQHILTQKNHQDWFINKGTYITYIKKHIYIERNRRKDSEKKLSFLRRCEKQASIEVTIN